jgi:hypothetical protein
MIPWAAIFSHLPRKGRRASAFVLFPAATAGHQPGTGTIGFRGDNCRSPAGGLERPSAPVAQLDRVLPSEGRGHRFESCRARQQTIVVVLKSLHRRKFHATRYAPVRPWAADKLAAKAFGLDFELASPLKASEADLAAIKSRKEIQPVSAPGKHLHAVERQGTESISCGAPLGQHDVGNHDLALVWRRTMSFNDTLSYIPTFPLPTPRSFSAPARRRC